MRSGPECSVVGGDGASGAEQSRRTSSSEDDDCEQEGPSPRVTDMEENVPNRDHRPRCRGGLRDRLESSCANPVLGVPVVVEARDAHSFARLPGMDETAAADVNPIVTKAIEEHQVSRLETIAGDGKAVPVLLRGIVWKRDTDLRIDVSNQTGAVEAGRARPAPSVRCADVLSSDLNYHLAGDGFSPAGKNGSGLLRRFRLG